MYRLKIKKLGDREILLQFFMKNTVDSAPPNIKSISDASKLYSRGVISRIILRNIKSNNKSVRKKQLRSEITTPYPTYKNWYGFIYKKSKVKYQWTSVSQKQKKYYLNWPNFNMIFAFNYIYYKIRSDAPDKFSKISHFFKRCHYPSSLNTFIILND